MTILVVAEHSNSALRPVTLSAVAAARQAGGDVHVLVAGWNAAAAAAEAAKIEGVTKVLLADDPSLEHQLPEAYAAAAGAALKAGSYSHVFFLSSASGKAAMPRLAAALDVPALTEIAAVVSPDTFRRFIYAGGVLATVKVSASPVVATVRPTSFEPAAAEGGSAPVEKLEFSFSGRAFSFESVEEQKSDRPDLLTAKRVVAAGRGIYDEEGFAAVEKLADKIGAAVGSTRAIVDMSIAPNETQIGQTGKIVAPDLYIGFGISGAIQHIAGMKDSKVIVSVNKDPEAPIFEVSDYYIEGDAAEVISELMAKL